MQSIAEKQIWGFTDDLPLNWLDLGLITVIWLQGFSGGVWSVASMVF
jgi:hypothetical protein